MTFYWDQRQVRIQGQVKKLDAASDDAYYFSRNEGYQIRAWIPQSVPLTIPLEEHYEKLVEKFKNEPITRPPFWGGYCLVPDVVEFWQGRPNRLHDRFRYELKQGQWECEQLAP